MQDLWFCVTPAALRAGCAALSVATLELPFNLRHFSNLSFRIPIWQGSECEWIVCVHVGRRRGGEVKGGRWGGVEHIQCILGNCVLWSRLTVLPFYTSSPVHPFVLWYAYNVALSGNVHGDEWTLLRLCVKARSTSCNCIQIMQDLRSAQHLLHPPWGW